MKSIREWGREVHALSRSKGWWDRPQTPEEVEALIPEKLMLVVSDLSEALEEYRLPHRAGMKTRRFRGTSGEEVVPAKPEGFPIELADAVIRILDLCEVLGIDLEQAIADKHAYNATRPHLHGGKRC